MPYTHPFGRALRRGGYDVDAGRPAAARPPLLLRAGSERAGLPGGVASVRQAPCGSEANGTQVCPRLASSRPGGPRPLGRLTGARGSRPGAQAAAVPTAAPCSGWPKCTDVPRTDGCGACTAPRWARCPVGRQARCPGLTLAPRGSPHRDAHRSASVPAAGRRRGCAATGPVPVVPGRSGCSPRTPRAAVCPQPPPAAAPSLSGRVVHSAASVRRVSGRYRLSARVARQARRLASHSGRAHGGCCDRRQRAERCIPEPPGFSCGEVEAEYVIGCDGAHSVVRASVGIAFEGASTGEVYYLGDSTTLPPLSGPAMWLMPLPTAVPSWRVFVAVTRAAASGEPPEPTQAALQ